MKSNPQTKPAGLDFPGRATLRVQEVAAKLDITEQHVLNLIEEGKLGAVNVGGGTRNFWRIPVEALKAFLTKRSNLNV